MTQRGFRLSPIWELWLKKLRAKVAWVVLISTRRVLKAFRASTLSQRETTQIWTPRSLHWGATSMCHLSLHLRGRAISFTETKLLDRLQIWTNLSSTTIILNRVFLMRFQTRIPSRKGLKAFTETGQWQLRTVVEQRTELNCWGSLETTTKFLTSRKQTHTIS